MELGVRDEDLLDVDGGERSEDVDVGRRNARSEGSGGSDEVVMTMYEEKARGRTM